MDKNYSEQIAINALISVFADVVSAGNQSPAFDEMDMVDISDGAAHQPIILLDEEDVNNLIPFLEEQEADSKIIDYLKRIAAYEPQDSNKQG
jgi:hypothetical protein